MARMYSEQIEKTQTLLTGLKNNLGRLKNKGLDENFLCNLKTNNGSLSTYNGEYDKLKADFKAKSIQTNNKLEDVKKQVKEAKKIVKRNFEQSEWKDFGISDKR